MKFIKSEQVEKGKLVITKKEFDKEIKEILDEIHGLDYFQIEELIKQKSGFKELE